MSKETITRSVRLPDDLNEKVNEILDREAAETPWLRKVTFTDFVNRALYREVLRVAPANKKEA